MSAQRHRSSGFTLVELMIVVMIIAVLAVSLAPSVRRSILEQRSGATAREVVRVVREARLRAMTQRRAHLVHIDGNRMRLLRGSNNSCALVDWTAINGLCDARGAERAAGTECVNVELGAAPWTMDGSGQVRLREIAEVVDPDEGTTSEQGTTPARVLCYTPNGAVHHGDGLAGPLSNNNPGGGGFVFQVDMLRPGTTETLVPSRRVLVPMDGYAKVLQ